jgi:hypothetical protein
MKGFSAPGVSDSASAEGNITKLFQSRPSPPPASAPNAQSFSTPMPASNTPSEEFKWPSDLEFNTGETMPGDSSSSVTGLFASLASTPQRQPDFIAPPHEPVTSFSSASPAESSAADPGGVTRLIQRLSPGVPATPIESLQPPAGAAAVSPPMGSSEPGEFTRIISGSAIKASMSAATPQTPAPAAPAQLIAIPVAVPPPAPLHVPSPPAFHAPKIEPPTIAAPKPALPAAAAPKSKQQQLVPILLVVNTFLLIVLIVLVIFALRAK